MVKNSNRINKVNENKQLLFIINILEEISQNEFIANNHLFKNDFNKITERLKDDSFKLAVVGEFSSGKSTFLNALIGKDLLKHGAQETTATITEIYNDVSQTEKTLLDVYYMNGDVKKNIASSKITEFTATSSESCSVAQEIERVVIKSKILEDDFKICFVDTPGLNGIADNHREKTIEQIKNAHACIYLMPVRGLSQSDIEFLKYICEYQHNIIFVQNFIDELKKLENETPEEKISEQKNIIKEKILSKEQNIRYEIVGISARKALIARAEEFSLYNDETLTTELRNRLYDESRFDDVFNAINNLIAYNEKEKIKIKDTVEIAINLLEQLKKVVTFENIRKKDEWEHSVEGINKKNYEQLIQSLRNHKNENLKKLNNYIESETVDIRKKCNIGIDNGIQNIERKMNNIISYINDIDEFQEYIDKSLSNDLYKEITNLEKDSNKKINIMFENLISNAVLRIQQYIGVNKESDKDLSEFKVKKINISNPAFISEENDAKKIEQLQQKINEQKKLAEKYKNEASAIENETKKIDLKLKQNNSELSQSRQMKSSEINRLGSMPVVETKYRKETYRENRGGLGILDALFGPKQKTRTVPYTDDTNQKKWKQKKSDIENKYKDQENKINTQIRTLESQKKRFDERLKHIKNTEPSRQKDIISMQNELEITQKNLKIKKEKLKQEYFMKLKKSAFQNVQQYLYKNIKDLLVDNFEGVVKENKSRVSKIIDSLFDLSYRERIKSLETLVNDNTTTNALEDTEKLLRIINKSTKELEVLICQL